MSITFDSLKDLGTSEIQPSVQTERPLTPTENTTKELAETILSKDPTLATVQFGMQFERISTEKLAKMEEKSNAIMESINDLLDLSQELASVDGESTLSEKALAILKKLREKGISLIDEDSVVTKEQIITLKSNISLRIDKLRTEAQQIFTKIQTLIQYMSSVNDIVKKMIADNADFIRQIIARYSKG